MRGYLLFFSILIFVLAREGEEGDLVTLQFPGFGCYLDMSQVRRKVLTLH